MHGQSDRSRFTAEHKTVLEQFRKFDNRYLTSDDIQTLTNIEPIKISAVLADLTAHGMVHRKKSDERGGYWLYTLTDRGRTVVMEH